jgi:molybdopterin-guanine dinucleotide biosynthesis protein A
VVRGRPGLTGVLLVGGASRRFGSPKALARFGSETLAERAHRLLSEVCSEVLVMGKQADAPPLPFPVHDDGSETRAAIVGVTAGLRLASHDLCLVVPTDMPWLTRELLLGLAETAAGYDVAVPHTGPLPGAYRLSALPVLERRVAAGELALRAALRDLRTRVVECDEGLLGNVNVPGDLARTR